MLLSSVQYHYGGSLSYVILLTGRKIESFKNRVDWIDPRNFEAASAAPIGKPANLESTVLQMLCLCVQMRCSYDPGEASDIPRLLIYQTLSSSEWPSCICVARVRVCYLKAMHPFYL